MLREFWLRKSSVMEVLLRVSWSRVNWSTLVELGRSIRRTEAP